MVKIVEKLLRAGEGRTLKRLQGVAAQVNAIEEDFEKLTDAELRAETDKFRERLADGETLDDAIRRGDRRIKVVCPFIKAWIERHPDYQELLQETPAS